MALEALDAEIDERVSTLVFEWYFSSEEKIFVCVGVLSDSHDCQQLLHHLHVQLEVLKFLKKDVVDMIDDPAKVYLASRHEFTALFNISAYFWQDELRVDFAISFDERVSKWGRYELSTRIPKGHVIP